MSLKHAILGLLNIQPMTGYDLKHLAFDNTVSHFWQADQAQIYRTLDKMEAEGLVISQLEIQTDRPNRRVYHITPLGTDSLIAWLKQPQSPPVYREPFLVQMFFGYLLDDREVLKHLDDHIAHHRGNLAEYQRIQMPRSDEANTKRKQTFWRLTLELGMALEKTYVDWLEKCQATIENAG